MLKIYFAVCALLIGLDQFTKYIALEKLMPIESITVIKGILDFTFVENRGAAFGILSGRRWFFVILTMIVSVIIIYIIFKLPKNKECNWVRVCLVLIFSGAIGNLIDRLIHGYVVDFLEITFISWPVFNIADIYVVTGTCILAFLLLFVIKDEDREKNGTEEY